jgi:hypothetical protein
MTSLTGTKSPRSWSETPVGDEGRLPALVLVNDADEPRGGMRWAHAEAAQVVPDSLLDAWDDALLAYGAESDELTTRPAVEEEPEPADHDQMGHPTASALESILMAGVAVTSWGAWELQSRSGDRSRRRLSLACGGLRKTN